MEDYLTCGQVARRLRVSISTLKRWIGTAEIKIAERRNFNGWRLFSSGDVEALRVYKREIKRNGKRFNETTLMPIVEKEPRTLRHASAG